MFERIALCLDIETAYNFKNANYHFNYPRKVFALEWEYYQAPILDRLFPLAWTKQC
jgi:hypothetical protein